MIPAIAEESEISVLAVRLASAGLAGTVCRELIQAVKARYRFSRRAGSRDCDNQDPPSVTAGHIQPARGVSDETQYYI